MIVSNRDGDYELYATPLDGSPVTKLTDNTADDNAGTGWSPDGSRIAFNSNRGGAGQDVYVMNADGSGVTQLTPNDGFDDDGPVWSPDASQIAFERDRKSTRLNSSHSQISYAVFCLKKKKQRTKINARDPDDRIGLVVLIVHRDKHLRLSAAIHENSHLHQVDRA